MSSGPVVSFSSLASSLAAQSAMLKSKNLRLESFIFSLFLTHVWCEGKSGSALTSHILKIKNNIHGIPEEAMFADVDLWTERVALVWKRRVARAALVFVVDRGPFSCYYSELERESLGLPGKSWQSYSSRDGMFKESLHLNPSAVVVTLSRFFPCKSATKCNLLSYYDNSFGQLSLTDSYLTWKLSCWFDGKP